MACPHCGEEGAIHEAYMGRTVPCPKCRQEFAVSPFQLGRGGHGEGNGQAVTSLVLGLIGLLAWIIPLFGFPVTIVGLVKGRRSLAWTNTSLARAGVTLCIIGLVLTGINSAVGAYLGATNQHPAFRSTICAPAPELPRHY